MLALENYHDDFGRYPPACVTSADGCPLHSWRVLLLPYLNEKALYDAYRFSEPWDGPHNSQLLSRMPTVYRCPGHGHHGPSAGDHFTNYVALLEVAPATESPDASGAARPAMIIVDVNEQSVPWMEPRDLTTSDFLARFQADAEFNHPDGTMAGATEGPISFLSAAADGHAAREYLVQVNSQRVKLSD